MENASFQEYSEKSLDILGLDLESLVNEFLQKGAFAGQTEKEFSFFKDLFLKFIPSIGTYIPQLQKYLETTGDQNVVKTFLWSSFEEYIDRNYWHQNMEFDLEPKRKGFIGEVRPLFYIPEKQRRLDHTQLSPQVLAKLATLPAEIHYYKQVSCSQKDFISILQFLKESSKFTASPPKTDWSIAEFRNKFRAGLTEFKSLFLTHFPDPKDQISILDNLTKSLQTDDRFLIGLDKELKDTKTQEKPIDNRISRQIWETMWYTQQLGLKPDQQNMVVSFMLEIEVPYRNENRKKELSKTHLKAKETKFNHFLHVLRISLGLIDMARKKRAILSPEIGQMLDTFLNPNHVFELCLSVLSHDLIEDDVYSSNSLAQALEKIESTLDLRNFDEDFVQRTVERAKILNTNNEEYKTKEEKDLKKYVKELFSQLKKDPILVLTKLSDLLHNLSTPYSENPKKLRPYTKLLQVFAAEGLFSLLPNRLSVRFFENNPHLPENIPGWESFKEKVVAANENRPIESLVEDVKTEILLRLEQA